MVSANDEDEHILVALEAGAQDYVTKPVKKRILLARVRSELRIKESQDETARLLAELEIRNDELAVMNERFKSLALEDGLTGLGNRRAMELELENIHAVAMRFHRPYSVALFDIDYFKRYNDSYGHQAGDDLLRSLSDRLTELLRKSDRIYRYGGEEFLPLYPECLPTGAAIITERICAAVLDMGFEHTESDEGFVTISAGIAHEPAEDRLRTSWETVVGEADKALYLAKERGRNRVVLWHNNQG
jgi:diguanylate cyclase (GGDEF)-like protein